MSEHTGAEEANYLMRSSLYAFTLFAFMELLPESEFIESPHLAILITKLEECESGRCKRLLICLPPRSLKSIAASVALPAWILGRNPSKKIICASYGQSLSDKHARDTRAIMESSYYKRAFSTRLNKRRLLVSDFETTQGGSRMATSVGGVLTGRGADLIIVDDPLKPEDALSETLRPAPNEWYDNTLRSRLNSKEDGVIIVVMQRLHQDDLIGHLLEKEHWDVLKFSAIAEQDETHVAHSAFGAIKFSRKAGEVLDVRRESLETLLRLRHAMGDYSFQSQYQQNPGPEGGAMIKTAWLNYYKPNERPLRFTNLVQSWDTANKSGELNDYSVCTTWGYADNRYYLVDVFRKRLEYPDLRRAVKEQAIQHRPNTIVIEDKGSGTQLLQDLRRDGIYILKPYSPPPGNDKQMRLFAKSALFENGAVWLPDGAPWLHDYVRELTTFPGTKHDDQVDSTTQALDYVSLNNRLDQWARLGRPSNIPAAVFQLRRY